MSPVAVHLPLADGPDQQALPPPQLLALLDDAVPQPARPRRAAQARRVQLPENPLAHFRRQHLGKVPRSGGAVRRHRDGASFTEKHRWSHNDTNDREPANTQRTAPNPSNHHVTEEEKKGSQGRR